MRLPLLPLAALLLAGVAAGDYKEDPNFRAFSTGFKRDRLTRNKKIDGSCMRTGDGATTLATFKTVLPLASDNLISRGVEDTNYIRIYIFDGSPEGQVDNPEPGKATMIGGILSTQFGTAAGNNIFMPAGALTFGVVEDSEGNGATYDGAKVKGWIFKPTDYVFVSSITDPPRRWYDAVGATPRRYWPKTSSGEPRGSRPSERLILTLAYPGIRAHVTEHPDTKASELEGLLTSLYGTKTITKFAYGEGITDDTPLLLSENSAVTCTARMYLDYDSGFQVWTPIFCSIMCAIATVMIIVLKCVKRKPSAAVVAETEKLKEVTDRSRRNTKASRPSGVEQDSLVAAEAPRAPEVQEAPAE